MYEGKKKAYMTVEASLVMPMILGGIVLVICLGMYLYNVCTLQQAVYIAALRGSQQLGMSAEEVKEYTDRQLELLLEGQILAKSGLERTVCVSSRRVEARTEMKSQMPFFQGLLSVTEVWTIEKTGKADRINPVDIIRNKRRFYGSYISE